MDKYYVVFITAPKDKALEIAEAIVFEKLGACVNIIDEVNSIYWWKGKVEKDKESLLIVKTKSGKFDELISKVKSIHPYTVPEIIALPIVSGNLDYLRWIEESV